MKNHQSEPNAKMLWGMKKIPLTDSSKEERMLDTVNRVISNITNDERNYFWPNTLTRHACVCPRHLKKTWPLFALNIKSMNQTSWGVPSLSSLRKWITHQNLTHGICSSDASELASFYAFWLMWVWISVSHAYPAYITPIKTLFLNWFRVFDEYYQYH